MGVPLSRVRALTDRPIDPAGAFVLYWTVSARRTRWNFGLQRAAELARELDRPVLVFEALRCGYPWASDRLHRFVIDGMRANAKALEGRATYYPYVEPVAGHGRGLLRELSASACAVVTDDYPAFFLPRMLDAAASQVRVRLEAVDSNGLIPVREPGRAFPTARGYRAFAQRSLRDHLRQLPDPDPLDRIKGMRLAPIPPAVSARWPSLLASAKDIDLAALPIDHRVPPVDLRGGSDAAHRTLKRFLQDSLSRYGEEGNDPDADATSHLSPYLHFGHISAHEVFNGVMSQERWTTRRLGAGASGAREGWWGVSASAEHFLDQLVVWRELAFNGSVWVPGFERYDTLPAWARKTLEAHLEDPRPHLYERHALEGAATNDRVWNAAQRQLTTQGWFHGYMRMVWGKKILEWSADPAGSLLTMEHLMNKYSLDGRDPVSYASFGWVLGRYDRPWFARPVFGTVRCMTTDSARRKLKMKQWLARYGG